MANCCPNKLHFFTALHGIAITLSSLAEIFADPKPFLNFLCSALAICVFGQLLVAFCWLISNYCSPCNSGNCPNRPYNLKDWAIVGGLAVQAILMIALLVKLDELNKLSEHQPAAPADDPDAVSKYQAEMSAFSAQKAQLISYIQQLAQKITNTELFQGAGMLMTAGYKHHAAAMGKQA